MIELKWVDPARLQDEWARIKPGLEKVEKTTSAWICEDIYMAIKLGTCSLFVCTAGDQYKGFVITQKQDSYGSITFHVWAAYSNAHDFNVLDHSLDQIKQWAENIKAKRITFSTSRPGWAKVAPKLGFKQSLITYELTL